MQERNPMIKVWIQDHDLVCINEHTKPSKYWLTKPSYMQNLVELTMPYSVVYEWELSKSKILLKD